MTLETRLTALEKRLQAAEDHLEILNLLSRYGPLVDSGSGQAAAALWIEGGHYNHGMPGGENAIKEARGDLAAMFESESHQCMVAGGVSHLTATPRIIIEGDVAEAIGYSYVIVRDGESWAVWRAAVNYWSLLRTPEGWCIKERLNRAVDGSEESLMIMRGI